MEIVLIELPTYCRQYQINDKKYNHKYDKNYGRNKHDVKIQNT